MEAFMEAWGHYQHEMRFSAGSPLALTYWQQRAENALINRCWYWIHTGKGSMGT